VCVWAGKEKISTNLAHHLRYHAHWQLTREEFSAADILNYGQFDKVDWEMVHRTLSAVPRMFQIFACKQVFDIEGTNRWLAKFNKTKETSSKCPSCLQVTETAEHVLSCCHAGRVETLVATIKFLDKWMKKTGTDMVIRECM
jgi:hypothetical protein